MATDNIRHVLEKFGLEFDRLEAAHAIIEKEIDEQSLPCAAELLHRIFLRVDRDSTHGRALARALGFTSQTSLSTAAKDFAVTKQYLHDLQTELEARIGNLAATGIVAPLAPDCENETVLHHRASRVLSRKFPSLRS